MQLFSADGMIAGYHQKLEERISESDNLNTVWDSIHKTVSTEGNGREECCQKLDADVEDSSEQAAI